MPKDYKKTRMSESELASFIERQSRVAMNQGDGELSTVRENLLSRYLGAKYGTERDGHSKFTTREVMEAVEWALPALLRMFYGSDRVVAFQPIGPEDEELAEQETDIINYSVHNANNGDGFLAIHNFIKSTLMNPTAYLKIWREEKQVKRFHEREEISLEQLSVLVEDPNIKLTEQESRTITVHLEGQEIPIQVFDVKYEEQTSYRQLTLSGVPAEEVLVDSELTSVNLDDARFVCHRSEQSFTELVQMGYDKAMLEKAGGEDEDLVYNTERINRRFYSEESRFGAGDDQFEDESMRLLTVYECYCWVDYDGDGVAEYRKVVMIGNKIFENEETDYQPLVAMSSILIPYKHNGLSIAEIVVDLQTLLTELTRQMLDNVYSINSRRRFIDVNTLTHDGRTLTAMSNPAASLVPIMGEPGRAVLPDPSIPIIGDILPVIQDARQSSALRTGIAPDNALDPAAVKDSTYGSFMGAMERANERVELIARIMAETGIKQLYRKAHQLHRKYPDITKAVKLRNTWVEVDPRKWNERTDVKVNVGLGFSNKQQKLTAIMQLMQIQKEALGLGLADVQNFYYTIAKFVEWSDLGAPEFFVIDPASSRYQPPQPQADPDLIRAESEAERNRAQAQASVGQVEVQAQELQLKARETDMKYQAEVFRSEQDAQEKQVQSAARVDELEIKRNDKEMQDRVRQVQMLQMAAEIERLEAEVELKRAQAAKIREETAAVDRELDIKMKQAEKSVVAPGGENSGEGGS